jgi:uncharacterized membrane protein
LISRREYKSIRACDRFGGPLSLHRYSAGELERGRLLRFSNIDILKHPDAVQKRISEELTERPPP